MGHSGEIVLHLSVRCSGLGIERISQRVALHPMKRPYTPIPRHQCVEHLSMEKMEKSVAAYWKQL